MSQHFVESADGTLQHVLLCQPKYLQLKPINEIAKDWLDKGNPIDQEKACKEHQALVDLYKANGVEVDFVDPLEGATSMAFARDFGFNLKEGYVLGRFKETIRQAESQAYKRRMEDLGVPLLAQCQEGYLEGGDFWQLDEKTLVIGLVQRTDLAGVKNIKHQLEALGYEILTVEAKEDYLHLDMIFNIVGEKTVVTYFDGLPGFFQDYLIRHDYTIIKVSEEGVFKHFCNLQALGNKRVISLKDNRQVNAQLREAGFQVFELDASEILKTGGGPHCLTFPLRRD